MELIKKKYNDLMDRLRKVVVNESVLRNMMFRWLNGLLALVAMFMTVINIFTKEYALMTVTFIFSMLCVMNIGICLYAGKIRTWLMVLFEVEALLLIAFFFISGIPNGFSAQWICLIPPFGLIIFGRKNGTVFSLVAFVMEIFLFWTPIGRSILMYHYTNEFMLRFPFVYVAFYIITLFIETCRSESNRQLASLEKKYENLYRHDELTGLFNRYGFNEAVEESLANTDAENSALFIIDIDYFKTVNDKYGHIAGDAVLKAVASVLSSNVSCDTIVARWGGEEFIAYMTGQKDYVECAEKLRKAVEASKAMFEDIEIKVTISVGVCIVDRKIISLEFGKIINTADKNLYAAKNNGRNRVEYAHYHVMD